MLFCHYFKTPNYYLERKKLMVKYDATVHWPSGEPMKFFCGIILLMLLSACVSTHMKKFVGKDIRDVMVADGPPVHQFDLGDGRRAFQWYIGGGTYVMPQTTTGTVTAFGNQAFLNSTTSGGQTVSSPGCLVTYFAKFDDVQNGWLVVDISYPDRIAC
jgi:hypothetical protein